MKTFKPHDFFGELGMGMMPGTFTRLATFKVIKDGLLLYINRKSFDKLFDEFPEILKELTRSTIYYLRKKSALKTGE